MAEHLKFMNLMIKQINWHFIYQSGFTVFMSSYLLLIAGTTLGMINLNVLFFSLVLLSVLAIIWIIKSNYQISPLRNAILFWVVAFLFTTFFSIDPRRSIDQFILCSVGIFIFYFSCFLVQKGWQINTIYQGLLFSGAILMLFAWLEFGSWYSQWLSVNPKIIIPTIQYRPASANIIALNLNLFLIIAINRIMQPGIKKVFRIILSLYIFSDLIILYMTSSRGGWFGTIAGIGSYILLSFIVNKEQSLKIIRFIKNNRLYRYLLIASVIFFVTAFVYILILQSNHPTHGNIFTSRSPFWIPAWKEFLKDPMSGTGPFTYGSTFMRYNSVPNDAIYAHSHGTPVNILTEMGIPGIAAGIFLVGSAFLSLWKRINFPDKKIQTTSHLALSALAAVGVHSLFDCFHLEPGGIWILYILIAIPLSINIIDIPKLGRPWLSLLPAFMLSILIWMRLPYVQGVNYANSNQWEEASISFQKAVNRDPWSAIAHQQLGITYAVLANSKPEFSLQSAIEEINITIQSEPSWALNSANLAALYVSDGNLSEAQKAALKSVELAPDVALYQLNLGSIAEKNQEIEFAKVAYMSALQIEPGWATSDYWKSSELRQSVIDG